MSDTDISKMPDTDNNDMQDTDMQDADTHKMSDTEDPIDPDDPNFATEIVDSGVITKKTVKRSYIIQEVSISVFSICLFIYLYIYVRYT